MSHLVLLLCPCSMWRKSCSTLLLCSARHPCTGRNGTVAAPPVTEAMMASIFASGPEPTVALPGDRSELSFPGS